MTLEPRTGDITLSICAWTYEGSVLVTKPDVAVSPDGKYLAYTLCDEATNRRQVGVLHDVATGVRTMLEDARAVHRVRFTSDGRFVYYLSGERDLVANPASAPRVEIRSTDGAIKKSIAFFSTTAETKPEELAIESLVNDFTVETAPNGKTAVVFGRQFTGNRSLTDNHAQGRLIVSPLDQPGETMLSTPATKSLGSNARLEFSPASDVALLTTREDEGPIDQAGGLPSRTMRVYEVDLGATPTMVEEPPWVHAGAPGPSLVVPSTFDGKRVIRWDYDPALTEVEGTSRYAFGHLVVVGRDGGSIDLSRDAGVKVHSGITDSWGVAGLPRLPARYAGVGDDAPIVFVGSEGRSKPVRLFFRPNTDTASSSVATGLFGQNVLTAPNGTFVYETAEGLVAFDAKVQRTHPVYKSSGVTRVSSQMNADDLAEAVADDGRLLIRVEDVGTLREKSKIRYAIASASGLIPLPLKAAPPNVSKLTPFGSLPASQECGYDRAVATFVGRAPAMLTSRARCFSGGGPLGGPLKELDLGRGNIPPELWIFDADGNLPRIRPVAANFQWSDLNLTALKGTSRVLVSGCDSTFRSRCLAVVLTTEPSAPEPYDGGTDAGADGSTTTIDPISPTTPTDPVFDPTDREIVTEGHVTKTAPLRKESASGCSTTPSVPPSPNGLAPLLPLLSLLLMHARRRRA